MRRFDTEAAMRQWCARLEVGTDIAPGSVDELEAHLAESVDDLRTRGLNEEEAFLLAVRRLGDLDALRVEFGKVEQGSRALEIGIAVLLGALLLPALAGLLRQILLWTAIALGLDYGFHSDYAVMGAVGATIWTVVGLAVFYAISGPKGARWRRGVDWFRRLGLRGQVLIVLAGAVMVPFADILLNYLASHIASPQTFTLVAIVSGYGWASVRLVLVALALWLLVRRGRPAAAKAELAADPTGT